MKISANIVFCFLLTLIFIFCSKKEDKPIVPDTIDFLPLATKVNETKSTAIKRIDGLGEKDWVFNTSTFFWNGKVTLMFTAFEDTISCYARERITFFQLPVKKQKIMLPNVNSENPNGSTPHSQYHRLVDDGHVVDGQWFIKDGIESYIEIVEVDSSARTFSGRYEVHYLPDPWSALQGMDLYADEISFLNGVFEVAY